MVSRPPISFDEFDILHFINKERKELGRPLTYDIEDIHKCEEAFNSGHTIAIRGMEFQLKSITAVVEGLANLFGQPSVGANLYLTPPDFRG
ncbi:hypothetical protein MLD38_005094 [Melastoma candidum]|uniref:Uncharacterized protein n=1 Tax=Melastoma candidum TaxID=119954 RepID=A0ACB9S867_9MYRT|nr:hypothetical protein MLD38_005094 [Melastoma candidum]